MPGGVTTLSEREKQVLRLLLHGHDAKSVARELGLSVHTVNEHLREARRKTGVSSSREAARLLRESEQSGPNSLGDKGIVVGSSAAIEQARQQTGAGHRVAWLAGGMLMMSLIIAAAALSSAFHVNGAPQKPADSAQVVTSVGSNSPEVRFANEWAALLDQRKWNESWSAAGTLFQSQMPEGRFASTINGVREPLGPVSSRVLWSATKRQTCPELQTACEIVQFKTTFAKRKAIETVVLAHEGSGWKVEGYFIR
jgi:DNA-binding CsgD family transcriptional regulator